MRSRVAVQVHAGDESNEIIRCHFTAERIHEVATVGSAKMFEALEPLARWLV